MCLKRPKRDWEEGAAAVEAAFTLFPLMLLLFGIFEFCYALWQWNTMGLAVQQAGRYVMINNTSCDASCAESELQTVLTNLGNYTFDTTPCSSPSAGNICVSATKDTATTPPTMKLTASYGFNILTTSPFTLSTSNTVPLD